MQKLKVGQSFGFYQHSINTQSFICPVDLEKATVIERIKFCNSVARGVGTKSLGCFIIKSVK